MCNKVSQRVQALFVIVCTVCVERKGKMSSIFMGSKGNGGPRNIFTIFMGSMGIGGPCNTLTIFMGSMGKGGLATLLQFVTFQRIFWDWKASQPIYNLYIFMGFMGNGGRGASQHFYILSTFHTTVRERIAGQLHDFGKCFF